MAQTEETAFPRLAGAELALVKPLAKPCDYADGAIVFRAGQPDIDLYVVESGRLEIRNPAGCPLARPSWDGAGGTRASAPATPRPSDLSGDAVFRQVSLGFQL